MNVKIVKLHEHQEFVDTTVEILNNEWPRSEIARLHSLKDSRDDLPCCLLLITKDSQEKSAVIGHSKLTRVHGKAKSVFIENVVVDKGKRGFGFGRRLMELSEDYACKQGYEYIHLMTHDKCKFYEHLGYQYSSAVSPVRANAKLLTPQQFSALQSHFGEMTDEDDGPLCKEPQQNDENNGGTVQKSSIMQPNTVQNKTVAASLPNMETAPPPPPPVPPPVPPPPIIESKTMPNTGKDKQYWMVKHL